MNDHSSTAAGVAGPAGVPRRSARYWGDILLSRVVPASIYGTWVAIRWGSVQNLAAQAVSAPGQLTFGNWVYLVNQTLTLVYLGILIVLFTVRLRRLNGRRDPLAVAIAFFGSFGVVAAAFLPYVWPPREILILPCTILSTAGIGFSLWTIAHLGRSFSILPEARRLVTSGPYSMSRHPLYVGEAIASAALLAPYVALPGAILLVLALSAQLMRIRWEEGVLAAEFPEYREYAGRVPRYVPRPWLFQR